MADIFSETLASLLVDCPGIAGAVFADLDGQEIAIRPRSLREEMRLCAAYGGIAMRRLTGAEDRIGNGPVRSVILHGSTRQIIALRVGDEYQLVLNLAPGTAVARATFAARETVTTLEANL